MREISGLEVYETTSKRILADKKLSPEAKQAQLQALTKPQAPVMPLLIVATDGIERRRDTNDRQREPVLLRGLLFTPDGERLVPSYTVKKGKTYRYYTPIKHRRFGAWASQHGPLPAAPIEELVTALAAPDVGQQPLADLCWDGFPALTGGFGEAGK